MTFRLRGEHEKLFEAFDRVMAMNPDHAEALRWAGWGYLAAGRLEEGVRLLERAVERRPDEYLALNFLISGYEMLGRMDDARRAVIMTRDRIIETLRKRPDNVHARSILAGMLVQLGEREAGIEQAERAVAMAPEDGRIRYNAACTFARAGLPERAIEQLREGIRNMPTYISDWPKLDPDLASLRDHPEFIRMFGKPETG